MIRLILVAILVAVAWEGYLKYQRSHPTKESAPSTVEVRTPARSAVYQSAPQVSSRYTCDGRTHCSQMTSCEEATFFLRNCPGTKMDGDNDGVPCETQWCR